MHMKKPCVGTLLRRRYDRAARMVAVQNKEEAVSNCC